MNNPSSKTLRLRPLIPMLLVTLPRDPSSFFLSSYENPRRCKKSRNLFMPALVGGMVAWMVVLVRARHGTGSGPARPPVGLWWYRAAGTGSCQPSSRPHSPPEPETRIHPQEIVSLNLVHHKSVIIPVRPRAHRKKSARNSGLGKFLADFSQAV